MSFAGARSASVWNVIQKSVVGSSWNLSFRSLVILASGCPLSGSAAAARGAPPIPRPAATANDVTMAVNLMGELSGLQGLVGVVTPVAHAVHVSVGVDGVVGRGCSTGLGRHGISAQVVVRGAVMARARLRIVGHAAMLR